MLLLSVLGQIELYFADETGVTMQPYIPYAWQKKKEYIRISTRKNNKRLNIFGLMKLDNTLKTYQQEKPINSEFIVKAINDFIQTTPDKPTVIVLDNSPVHRSKLVQEQLQKWENANTYLFFLPKYSPHLNPIEILWRFIKYRWLKKYNYDTWNKLRKATLTILKGVGSIYTINFKQNYTQFNSA